MAVTINGNGVVTADGTSTSQGQLVLGEDTDNGVNTITLQAAASIASNITLTLPATAGTSGQTMTSDGSGVLSFGTLGVGGGGTGATTLTANNVLLGNGTSAVQFVAPSTTGNVLTSNGTTWVSQSAASGAQGFVTQLNGGNVAPTRNADSAALI